MDSIGEVQLWLKDESLSRLKGNNSGHQRIIRRALKILGESKHITNSEFLRICDTLIKRKTNFIYLALLRNNILTKKHKIAALKALTNRRIALANIEYARYYPSELLNCNITLQYDELQPLGVKALNILIMFSRHQLTTWKLTIDELDKLLIIHLNMDYNIINRIRTNITEHMRRQNNNISKNMLIDKLVEYEYDEVIKYPKLFKDKAKKHYNNQTIEALEKQCLELKLIPY